MKERKRFLLIVIGLLVMSCSSERPWIGTYALEVTEENKEAVEMFKEMNLVWPEITLKEDGSFLVLKTEGNARLTGTYTVEGTTITLKMGDVAGEPPKGKYAEPHTAEFRDDFKILMMEGPDKERWVRKEINEAFMK